MSEELFEEDDPDDMHVWLETASPTEVKALWTAIPMGSPWFQGDLGDRFAKRMCEIRTTERG